MSPTNDLLPSSKCAFAIAQPIDGVMIPCVKSILKTSCTFNLSTSSDVTCFRQRHIRTASSRALNGVNSAQGYQSNKLTHL